MTIEDPFRPGSARRRPDGFHRPRRAGGPLTDAEKRTNAIIRELLSTKTRDPAQRAQLAAERADVTGLLTRLQKGETSASLGGQTFSLPQPASEATNLVTLLLDAGLGPHLGEVGALILEVVATLFDHIFDDGRIPVPVKELIGRLQIPVLQLAMVDHDFFSDRAHPARRLINALAHAGITWDGEMSADTTFYRAGDATVRRIVGEFAADAEVFARCQRDFDAFLAEQDRRADERAATLTERLKQREQQELAREVARKAIVAPLAKDGIPEVVRTFAETTWLSVLTRARLEGGEEGDAWREALATLDGVVWSVLPKYDAASRQDMVKRLPALLRTVKAGMARVAVGEAAQKEFFAELVRLHATALKAGMTPPAASSKTAPKADRAAAGIGGDEPTPQSLELDLLSRGSWIELRDESGGARRLRLSWISPACTMYLFANRQGQRALALTRNELTRRFATGEAASIYEEALLDRVVDDVLDEFQR
ncbi:MAG: DUF1631 family protein [Aromatoleum sp.]|nr:DUF1631 family protein [Aromatoleum sp.]MDT3670255.1 DUF1631 family protein [Aromatoleum sp.]